MIKNNDVEVLVDLHAFSHLKQKKYFQNIAHGSVSQSVSMDVSFVSPEGLDGFHFNFKIIFDV
jgi:hypothetical protein